MRTDLAAHLGPIGWELAPLWSVAPRVVEKNVGMVEKNLLSLSFGRVIRKKIDAIGGLRPESYETYNIVEADDVVLRMTDLQNDKRSIRVAQATERGLITSAYITVRPDESKTDPRFIAAVLRAYDIQKAYYEMGAGVRQNLGYAELIDLPIPMPPKGTQRRIADYLDRETGEIDEMIAKMDELAGVLDARKQTVISKVISRGVNETAEFTDAGIPGASVIPAHWNIIPLQLAFSFQEGPGILAVDFRNSGIPLLRISSVREKSATLVGCNYLDPDAVARRWSHFQVDAGDLLISSSASMGTVSEVGEDVVGAVPYTGIIRIKPGRMIKDFIRWFVVSREFLEQVDLLKTGSTIQHYGPTHLALMRAALPPANEQKRIADHLDEVTCRIDQMLAKVAELKSLLTERRAALIVDVVTGRKEVA